MEQEFEDNLPDFYEDAVQKGYKFDPSEPKVECCDDCYQMSMHMKPPTKVFLQNLKEKFGWEGDIEEVLKQH